MPHRLFEAFFHISSALVFEIKMSIASIVAGGAFLADIATEMKGVEELGLKAILCAALIWIVRLHLTQQKEHKQELRDIWALHKKEAEDRELRANETREANTRALNELTSLTKEQTDYFKTVTRNIVEDRIKAKPTPTIP